MWFIYLFMFHAVAEDTCPAPGQFKYVSTEFKLNLDGNGKPDVIARFAPAGEAHFYRRGLIMDAPAKLEGSQPTEWLEECQEGGENPLTSNNVYEKAPAGDRDLLFDKQAKAGSVHYRYLSADGTKLKTEMHFVHPDPSGHFNETHKKDRLAVRVFGDDGELSVGGAKVDLDQLALKARCRVRELHIEVKYEWDRKERKFKEVDQGCVMGSAID